MTLRTENIQYEHLAITQDEEGHVIANRILHQIPILAIAIKCGP